MNRKQIGLCENTTKLNFLGAGYPLIFNYYLYCVLILTILFLSFGVYAIYSNYNGHFCVEEQVNHTETLTTETHALQRVLLNEDNNIFRFLSTETSASTESTSTESTSTENTSPSKSEKGCTIDWIMIISLANKLDNEEANYIQSYFAIVAEILIMIVLIYFRKHQRQINNDVDEETNTPADYTIIVSGIPLGLNCQYESELKRIFDEDPKTQKKFGVEKVNLVFNTKKIEELEHELKKIVNKKKKVLVEQNFNYDKKEIIELDSAFEKIEEKLEKVRNHMMKTYEGFAGIAFISFSIEDGNFEKNIIFEKKKSYIFLEKI